MTPPATVVLIGAGAVVALGDWAAVAREWRRAEYLLKPAALALLVAAAAAADLGSGTPWVVAALALGLVGDVGLMLTAPGRLDAAFLGGLGAFLVGHGLWMVAFVLRGVHPVPALVGLLVVLGVAGVVLRPVLRSVLASDGPGLTGVVAAYTVVLGGMAVLAVATGLVLVAVGGVAFLVSDAVLAHDRFVRETRFGPLAVIVSYHLAQFLLVIGLLRRG